MNEIIKYLNDIGLIYSNVSIDLSLLNNITCKQVIANSRQGRKENRYIYKWFADYNGTNIVLSGKSRYNIYADIYCKSCNKRIKQHVVINGYIWSYHTNTFFNKFEFRCKQCSCKLNSINGKEKCNKTNLNKYGVKWTFQRPEQIKKSIETKIKKYGVDYQQKCAKKAKQTYMKKHGVDHNGKVPHIRKCMRDNWKKTVNAKSIDELKQWNENRLKAYTKENGGIFGKYNKQQNSKIAMRFIDDIKSKMPDLNIINEKQINHKYVDFYIENVCIIEFYGDYWHANPLIYNENDIIYNKDKLTAKEIWEKDNNRLFDIYKSENLPIIIVWEYDYKKNKEQCVNLVIECIQEIYKNGNLDRSVITIN